jgi:mycofactocin glycosyltransferase
MTLRFRPDSSLQRFGNVLVGGSPLRLFRMSTGGVLAVEAMIAGEQLSPLQTQLAQRLADAGALHPHYDDAAASVRDVTVVIPAFGGVPPHGAAFNGVAEVIVVDDASPQPILTPASGRVIRRTNNGGPAAARNTGLAEVSTRFVAFVDSDTEFAAASAEEWLQPLLAHFNDERVALVAPRVASAALATGTLAQYEARRSPLDLGGEPARIAAGTRVSYVPAATIVCRVDALRSINTFDTSMRFGEDVDLVWRLVAAGWVCRYEPAVVVRHRPRSTLSDWLRQRFHYGTSAAALAERHPGAVAPLRMSGWSALVWALVGIRRPLIAAGVAGGTAVALTRKLRDVPPAESLRLAGLGHLFAGQQVAAAISRAWWPIAVPLAVLVRRLRPAIAAAFLLPPVIEWVSRRKRSAAADHEDTQLDPLRFVALRVADDVAYSAGVWRGVVRARAVGALLPSFTSWPPRGDR